MPAKSFALKGGQTRLYTSGLQLIVGVALMVLSAKIQIPLQPVPITLQTLGVMFVGLTFTPAMALSTLVTYVGLGLLGAPVFSTLAAGPIVVFGAKAGYILGMVVAVYLTALTREKLNEMRFHTDSFWVGLTSVTVGSIALYAMGISWLSTFVGWEKAFALGFVPFIIPGLVKAGLLSGIMAWYRR